jgi:hypothetical protein
MSDLADLKIWDDPAIRDSLSWYLDVAENRRPAKFRIAATLATGVDPVASDEDALWAELDRLTPIFLGRWQAIREGAPLPPTADGPSLLEVCRELAYRMLAHCNFCPWNCRVDRMAGAKFGACKLASASRVSSHFHHTGEELFYRGTEGSGTIFFTSCNMRNPVTQPPDRGRLTALPSTVETAVGGDSQLLACSQLRVQLRHSAAHTAASRSGEGAGHRDRSELSVCTEVRRMSRLARNDSEMARGESNA